MQAVFSGVTTSRSNEWFVELKGISLLQIVRDYVTEADLEVRQTTA